MDKILYTSMTLTMTEDWVSLLESQHAIAIVSNAAPASLPIKIALGSVREVPSNMETSKEGTIANANPVTPSTSAVIVSKDFIFYLILELVVFWVMPYVSANAATRVKGQSQAFLIACQMRKSTLSFLLAC